LNRATGKVQNKRLRHRIGTEPQQNVGT